jgi:hypothetical protein
MKSRLYYLIFLLFLTSCSYDSGIGPSVFNGISQGGSTAKFAISGDYLYAIDNTTLSTFDISDETEIRFLNKIALNAIQLETIFPYGDQLYLGSTTGVLIINISNPALPVFLSEYQHIVSCDPVVTNGSYAYVTLRSGNNCGQVDDELQIIDLANILDPQIVASYPLTSPKGLALNGDILYVCDAGIKVFDVSDVTNIREINHIPNIPANDVIYYNNQILVTAETGFYQFNVADNLNFSQIGYYSY